MDKLQAINLFGGVQKTADALGVTRQTIWFWPMKLEPEQQDRVIGAAFRLGLNIEALKHENGNGTKRTRKADPRPRSK